MFTPSRRPVPSSRSIFLALQGGGAKGIVHVGGLLAIDDLKLKIQGVSGTSAGSMVAALVAAGFKGKDLVDPDKRNHIFKDDKLFGVGENKLNFKKPSDLFTTVGWQSLKVMRFIIPLLGRLRGNWIDISIFRWVYQIILGVALVCGGHWVFMYHAHWLVVPLILLLFIALGAWYGFTTVRKVRALIDGALVYKVGASIGKGKDKDITFKDLWSVGRIPLKIIATNSATESLELFCAERTPDVPVADAVAASICLPFIFTPWSFEFLKETATGSKKIKGKFLDGGLVSNLPAWPFDEERLLYPKVRTVAFSLDAEHGPSNQHWMSSIVNTIVNGTGEIHTRAAGQIINVPLKTTLKTLEFDISEERAFSEVSASRQAVLAQLGMEINIAPRALKKAAEEIRKGIIKIIQNSTGGLWASSASNRVRVAIAVQRANSMNSMTTSFFAGYRETDLDKNLTVALDAPFIGEAWLSKEAVFTEVSRATVMAPYAARRVWTGMKWLICVPLVANSSEGRKVRPCVITIDSDIPFNNSSPYFAQQLEQFVQHAALTVRAYDTMVGVAKFVQGDNTWL